MFRALRLAVLNALCLTLLPPVHAQTPAPASPPGIRQFLGLGPAPDPEAAARGEKLYAPNCAFCHGAKANGAEAPDLVRSPLVLHDEKGELIAPVVHLGRPAQGMPAFPSFTEPELLDLAQFLHMRVEFAANRGLYQVQNIVTGNAPAGEAYFNGPGQCRQCHSPAGDLAHIASKLAPADLQQAFLYPRVNSAPAVTVTLPNGQTVQGTLKQLDDFHISLFDPSGAYHSIPRSSNLKLEIEDGLAAHRRLLAQYTDGDMHNLTAYLAALK